VILGQVRHRMRSAVRAHRVTSSANLSSIRKTDLNCQHTCSELSAGNYSWSAATTKGPFVWDQASRFGSDVEKYVNLCCRRGGPPLHQPDATGVNCLQGVQQSAEEFCSCAGRGACARCSLLITFVGKKSAIQLIGKFGCDNTA